jgi:DNA-directed RNA polymerase sigma subunit (sigma70/sigma32)
LELQKVLRRALEEIGNELNLTRERCRQIKREALKKLKKEIQFFFD